MTEAFLFKLILKTQTAEEQLSHLIQRPEDAKDLLDFGRIFLPINDWNCVRQHLGIASPTRTIQRVLWFLSSRPRTIPKDIIVQLILPLLKHEDSIIRATVLQILFFLKSPELIRIFVDGGWAWNIDSNQHWRETHWGSLLLCRYATYVPYSNLRNRIDPNYLGYAVQCRGIVDGEVKQYSEDLQNIWVNLSAKMPDLLIEISSLSIATSISESEDFPKLCRIQLSDNLNSQKITFLSREASWGGLDRGDSQGLEELVLPNIIEQSQQIQRQTINEIIKQQTAAGNTWFAKRVFPNVLDQIVKNYPHLVGQWLNPVLTGTSEGRRYLCLGYSFYEALCTVLLKIDPARGVLLYWRLQNSGIKTDVIDEHSNFKLIDYALFQALPSEDIKHAWQRKLEECTSDSELLEIAVLAQHGDSSDWLWETILQGVKSTAAFEKSRAIVLLAFMQERRAFDHLNSLLEGQPDTWIRDLLEYSQQLLQRNNWARHWFFCFLSANDDVTAWSSFRLFLQCVDSRFWYWQRQIKAEYSESNFYQKRCLFMKDNLDEVKNRIKKNENPLREKFLGHKVLVGQACPWMPAS